MGRQEAVFLEGEGDRWFERNLLKVEAAKYHDPVYEVTKHLNPASVFEIGCGTGWRLARYSGASRLVGIDPSAEAISMAMANHPDIEFFVAHACDNSISVEGSELVIFGFCLYLCDRENLFKIVEQADDVLNNGGHLVIHDFDPEYPHKVPYHHVAGLYSYKMDYSKLWLSNPAYSLVHKEVISDGTAVWVLKKDIAAGWPEEAAP